MFSGFCSQYHSIGISVRARATISRPRSIRESGGPDGVIRMNEAEEISSKQKQISVSEFFEKNKHFLGFDTLPRAVITAVKESVDNSLDACEEARILPDIRVEIRRTKGDELELITQDNGPGIPRDAIENVFGKFLLGSRFHAIRQTRGQQGIGITGVVMYSQLTTGSKTHVVSKIKSDSSAVYVDLGVDTKKNKAIKSGERRDIWIDDKTGNEITHGLRIRTQMKAKYQRGRKSVYQYLRMTSIVNPHASISLVVYDKEGSVVEEGSWIRTSNKLPRVVEEIKPHPHGIQLGTLQRMLREANDRRMTSFLKHNFSGVSPRAAKEILAIAEVEEGRTPKRIKADEAKMIITAFQTVKLLKPPMDCLSPIEDLLIKKGLSKAIDSRFASTVTRNPSVSQGNPFQIEVGLVFGGDLTSDGPIEILRFANRVPLMYQQGGCLLTKALEAVNWKSYGLEQPGGSGIPKGPAAVLIHLASTNVQFTSEAKEAVSYNEEVFDEIQIQAYESSIYRSYSNIDPTKLDYVYEALRINKIGIDGIENIRDKYIINRTFFDNLLTGFYNNFEDSRTANLAMEEHLLSINNQWTIQDEVDWWEENQEYSIRNWRTSDEFKELMLTKSQNTLNPDPDVVVSDSYPNKVLRKYCDSL